jgi:ribonuclease-3
MRLFRRPASEIRKIERRLGYRFRDPDLLVTALTHRSHAYERTDNERTNYERLEFLGDAMLGFLVSEWLYGDDGHAPEGVLTRRRQTVVRTSTLAETAREIGLAQAIRLGRGEERTGGREKPSLMADTFEAVLGAIYLDGGVRSARLFVRRHLGGALEATRLSREASDDYKTRLQETIQAKLRRTPRYRIVATTGPAHALLFRVEVLINGRVVGNGSGTNRKRAEQEAARDALRHLDRE